MPIADAPIDESWQIAGELDAVANLVKGTGMEAPERRRLAGWVTTYGTLGPDGGVIPTRDREGQVFEAARQLGLIDFTGYLTKGVGVWNYAHTPIRVGLPETLEFHDGTTELSRAHRKVGFWGTGHLFDADPSSWDGLSPAPSAEELERADYCWGLASDLMKGPRALGFSVQGTMRLSPCRSRILSAKVTQCAVLEYPHNPDATVMAMAKGFGFLRRGMVGRRPCGSCSCPPGSCEIAQRPEPARVADDLERLGEHPRVNALARRRAAMDGITIDRARRYILAGVRSHMEQ